MYSGALSLRAYRREVVANLSALNFNGSQWRLTRAGVM